MKYEVFNGVVAVLTLLLAKVFAKELDQVSWLAFLVIAAAAFLGSFAGGYFIRSRKRLAGDSS